METSLTERDGRQAAPSQNLASRLEAARSRPSHSFGEAEVLLGLVATFTFLYGVHFASMKVSGVEAQVSSGANERRAGAEKV